MLIDNLNSSKHNVKGYTSFLLAYVPNEDGLVNHILDNSPEG